METTAIVIINLAATLRSKTVFRANFILIVNILLLVNVVLTSQRFAQLECSSLKLYKICQEFTHSAPNQLTVFI